MNAEQAPGVKRGGTVNIVTHAVEVVCSADDIPESIDVDISEPRDQLFEAPERRRAAGQCARGRRRPIRRWSPSCRRRATPKK